MKFMVFSLRLVVSYSPLPQLRFITKDFIDSEYLFIVMDILRLLLFIIVPELKLWKLWKLWRMAGELRGVSKGFSGLATATVWS